MNSPVLFTALLLSFLIGFFSGETWGGAGACDPITGDMLYLNTLAS